MGWAWAPLLVRGLVSRFMGQLRALEAADLQGSLEASMGAGLPQGSAAGGTAGPPPGVQGRGSCRDSSSHGCSPPPTHPTLGGWCRSELKGCQARLYMIPDMAFPFPPPWMGMPRLHPLPSSYAFAPVSFAGLTTEELRALEGRKRQHLEARLQSLRNMCTLLDAVMHMNQYLTVLAFLGHRLPARHFRQPHGRDCFHGVAAASTSTPTSGDTTPSQPRKRKSLQLPSRWAPRSYRRMDSQMLQSSAAAACKSSSPLLPGDFAPVLPCSPHLNASCHQMPAPSI